MTPGGLVKAALAAGVFPAGTRALGRGSFAWPAGELEYSGVIDRGRWQLFVGDAVLGPALEKYGRLSVALDPAGPVPAVPDGTRLPPEVATTLREFCRGAQEFVTGRRGLAELLMAPGDVRRGDVVAWLPPGSWPARLAQAFILATDLGDEALATAVRDLVRSRPTRSFDRRPRHSPHMSPAERDRLDSLYLDLGDIEQDVAREFEVWLGRYRKAL